MKARGRSACYSEPVLSQHVNAISCRLCPNEARPGGQGLLVSADSLDQPVLCQPWIMDDGEPAGLTGNNSLPRGPTPFAGHETTSREMKEGGGEEHHLKKPGSYWLPSCHG